MVFSRFARSVQMLLQGMEASVVFGVLFIVQGIRCPPSEGRNLFIGGGGILIVAAYIFMCVWFFHVRVVLRAISRRTAEATGSEGERGREELIHHGLLPYDWNQTHHPKQRLHWEALKE